MNDPMLGDDSEVGSESVLDALMARLTGTCQPGSRWSLGPWSVEIGPVEATRPWEIEETQFVCAFMARRAGTRSIEGLLRLTVDDSGWIRAAIELPGYRTDFFVERIYEEFECWPPGSPADLPESGRIGKRASWVQLEAEYWPHLAALAEGRFISLEWIDPHEPAVA